MSSYTVDDYAQHPRAVIGPRFVTAVIQGFQTGLIINLAYRFWKEDFAERMIVKIIVVFVTALSFAQTSLICYIVYNSLILNFADWANFREAKPVFINLMMSFTLAMPPKAIFIWRCWKLVRTKWRKPLLVILLVLYNGTLAAGILLIRAFYIAGNTKHATSSYNQSNSYFISSASTIVVLDTVVGSTLMYNILPSRPSIFKRSFRTSVYRLSFIIWEGTFPGLACIFTSLILIITTSKHSFWAYLFYDISGQMYVIALFVVLMGMQLRVAPGGLTRHRPAQSWSMNSLNTMPNTGPDTVSAPVFRLQTLPPSHCTFTAMEGEQELGLPANIDHEACTCARCKSPELQQG